MNRQLLMNQNVKNFERGGKMIIDYNCKYDDEIKELLMELQMHIVSIDEEKYSFVSTEYAKRYFDKTMEEINKYGGKMLLYIEHEKLIGLVVGIINNDERDDYDFKVPKRGRITELVVSKLSRSNGIGSILIKAMEEHLKYVGCKNILLGVFGYDRHAINFYEKNGYHTRQLEMSKEV